MDYIYFTAMCIVGLSVGLVVLISAAVLWDKWRRTEVGKWIAADVDRVFYYILDKLFGKWDEQ